MIQLYIPWEGEGEGDYDENLKYNIDFFYMHLFTMRCQCVLNWSFNQEANYSCPRQKYIAKITCDKCYKILCLSSRNMIDKTMCEVL
jgi:hypothetical protein